MDKVMAERILLWWHDVKGQRDRDGYSMWNVSGKDDWAYMDKPEFVTEAERVSYGI